MCCCQDHASTAIFFPQSGHGCRPGRPCLPKHVALVFWWWARVCFASAPRGIRRRWLHKGHRIASFASSSGGGGCRAKARASRATVGAGVRTAGGGGCKAANRASRLVELFPTSGFRPALSSTVPSPASDAGGLGFFSFWLLLFLYRATTQTGPWGDLLRDFLGREPMKEKRCHES